MTHPPQIPESPANIPPAPLWAALIFPPAVTVSGNLFCAMLTKASGSSLIFVVPIVVVSLILIFSIVFLEAVKRRFRGASLVFLYFAYLLGQAIICLALWFGTCLLVL